MPQLVGRPDGPAKGKPITTCLTAEFMAFSRREHMDLAVLALREASVLQEPGHILIDTATTSDDPLSGPAGSV